MKCKCGGIMIPKQLSIDTTGNVCLLCGRDDLPRQIGLAPAVDPEETAAPKKRAHELPRTCPGCGRPNLIFSGKCIRCRTRQQRGLDLVSGLPLAMECTP